MRVLLLGSGGREHALAWAIARSSLCGTLFIAPGNPGMAALGTCVPLKLDDHAGIIAFGQENRIDLVVVGPEAPLVAGLSDELIAAGMRVFGPSKAAAQLEGSKDFTKSVAVAANAPTAAYRTFTSLVPAVAHVHEQGAPIVVKYDGLMAGKGVTVAETIGEAVDALETLYASEPAARVVIEECLIGEEVSYFCLVDGETVLPFGAAQDHKRALDGDKGPNTGGMGVYSPAPVFTVEMERRVLDEIVKPVAREMAARGMPYRGILFAGLMITATGPKLIEFNCRFGDPECQVLMLRLADDLLPILDAVARGQLAGVTARFNPESAVGVVMATRGYPGSYPSGTPIGGLDDAAAMPGATVFHAGTRLVDGKLVSAGGRVLTICATGKGLPEARQRAYDAVAKVDWPDGFCRSDIGAKGLAHLKG
ncbi:MAG: phosphoribosylamine--glycine ligase [Methylobacterium sp.]|nr:phosphoribosylamine--glycine ligase [Methylobacterium sp.]MCA3651295.1 phosphoribosylamine--glycine ligase [Methylobacterium sp.]MCA4921476.1 phosphoribosylamine--glycine ligase [Methylobacterium sp.]